MAPEADLADAVANRLLDAHRTGRPADDQALQGLLSSAAEAYAVQERVVRALGGARHWKSGAASRLEALKHSPLPAASRGRIGPCWVEAEVALRMGRAVTADDARALTFETAPALVDAMCVSIEVLGTRWAGGRAADPLLKLADFLMHAGLVLDKFVPYSPRAWDQQECRVRIGHADWQSFRGTLGLGDPLWVLPGWLRHATRNGGPVAKGVVVSTGSWCGMLEARAGDRVQVEFPGIGAAAVQL